MPYFDHTKIGEERSNKYWEQYNRLYEERKASLPDNYSILSEEEKQKALHYVEAFNRELSVQLKEKLDM